MPINPGLARLMAQRQQAEMLNQVSAQQANGAAENVGGKTRQPASPFGRAMAGSVRPRIVQTK